jgi:hypothetical protein
MSRIRSSFALLAGCAVALGFGGTAAVAADMGLPTKAAPMVAAAPPPLDIHGFVEFDWESTLINPNGQVLGTHGAESMVAGLNWTVYHGGGWINSVTLGGLVAADWINGFQGVWALGSPTVNGNFFDLVGAVTASVTFWNFWTLREQFTVVTSQDVGGIGSGFTAGGGFGNGFGPLPFNQLTLAFNDAKFDFTGWGITWNPYVTWFYQFNNFGQQAVGTNAQTAACFTCGPNTYTFFVGIDPTLSLAKWGLPLTLKAPTYVTVGPANFWVNGAGNAVGVARSCGPGCTTTVGQDGNLGVFTTGLTAIWDLGRWIPKNYGGWYVKGGFQWYDLINSNLVLSENESVGCAINAGESCKTSKSIWVGFFGIGATF